MGMTIDSPAQTLPGTGLPAALGDAAPLLRWEPQQALWIRHTQEHVPRASETAVCESPAGRSPPPRHVQESCSEQAEQGTETEAPNASCDRGLQDSLHGRVLEVLSSACSPQSRGQACSQFHTKERAAGSKSILTAQQGGTSGGTAGSCRYHHDAPHAQAAPRVPGRSPPAGQKPAQGRLPRPGDRSLQPHHGFPAGDRTAQTPQTMPRYPHVTGSMEEPGHHALSGEGGTSRRSTPPSIGQRRLCCAGSLAQSPGA